MSEIRDEKEFFRTLSTKSGMQQKDVRKVYYSLLDMIMESGNSKDTTNTRLPNFAVMEVTVKEPYIARDPRNSKAVLVDRNRKVNMRLLDKFKGRFTIEKYTEDKKKS
jgi:nucleoid DNA-binding protein